MKIPQKHLFLMYDICGWILVGCACAFIACMIHPNPLLRNVAIIVSLFTMIAKQELYNLILSRSVAILAVRFDMLVAGLISETEKKQKSYEKTKETDQ